jgi:hypothetical protein
MRPELAAKIITGEYEYAFSQLVDTWLLRRDLSMLQFLGLRGLAAASRIMITSKARVE